MDILSDIKSKIVKSFQTNDQDFLVSLKAFLCEKENCPWTVINEHSNPQETVDYLQSKPLSFFTNQNTANIKKYRVFEIDLHVLPKNKKIFLINDIDEILNSWNVTIISDELRCCPFQKDTLGNYIQENKDQITSETYLKYLERKQFLNKLFIFSEYKKTIYQSSSVYAKNNKIKEYWKNIWGDPRAYHNHSSSIENIIL